MVLQHTEAAKKFYQSTAWKKTRQTYINSLEVPDMCEKCLEYNIYTKGKIVDHIVEINIHNINDPSITLSHDNFQYLCISCHNKKTFGNGETDAIPTGTYFDEYGQLQIK